MSLSGMTMELLEGAKGRVAALGSDFAQAPEELHGVIASVTSALMSGSGVRAVTYLLVLMLVGCGAEWLYWSYAWAPLRAIESMPVTSPRQALRLGARRLVLLGSGLVLFTLAIIATSAAFAWPPGIQQLVVAVTLFVLVLRLAWIAASVVLAPGRARLRLVPVAQRKVGWLVAAVLAAAGLAAIASLAPVALEQIAKATHAAGMVRFVFAALTALLLVIAAFAFVRDPAPAVAASRRLRLPKFPRAIVVALMVAAVFLLWLLGSTTAAVIAAIAAAVVVVQMSLRELCSFSGAQSSRRSRPRFRRPRTTSCPTRRSCRASSFQRRGLWWY